MNKEVDEARWENATYEVESITLIPSEPPDGSWYTVVAATRIFGENGDSAISFGYASDIEPNQEVVDRAISESVERTVVQLLYGHADSANPRTTTGSAVHRTIAAATRNAQRELTATREFIRRFHQRNMGQRLPNQHFPFMPKDFHIATWVSEDDDTVFVALLSTRAQPKLSMGFRSCGDDGWKRAVDLCVVEVAQPRAWVRDVMSEVRRPTSLAGVSSPAERAIYWSSVDDSIASAVFETLVRGDSDPKRHVSPGHANPIVRPVPAEEHSADADEVVSSVRIQGEQGTLYFVRVEDDVSRGRYIDSKVEQTMFWRPGAGTFMPHPLI